MDSMCEVQVVALFLSETEILSVRCSENLMVRWDSTGMPKEIEKLNNLPALFTVRQPSSGPLHPPFFSSESLRFPASIGSHPSSPFHPLLSPPLHGASSFLCGFLHFINVHLIIKLDIQENKACG